MKFSQPNIPNTKQSKIKRSEHESQIKNIREKLGGSRSHWINVKYSLSIIKINWLTKRQTNLFEANEFIVERSETEMHKCGKAILWHIRTRTPTLTHTIMRWYEQNLRTNLRNFIKNYLQISSAVWHKLIKVFDYRFVWTLFALLLSVAVHLLIFSIQNRFFHDFCVFFKVFYVIIYDYDRPVSVFSF